MGRKRTSGRTGGMAATVALVSLVLAGLPTAGWALDSLGGKQLGSVAANLTFTPASVDPQVARLVGESRVGSPSASLHARRPGGADKSLGHCRGARGRRRGSRHPGALGDRFREGPAGQHGRGAHRPDTVQSGHFARLSELRAALGDRQEAVGRIDPGSRHFPARARAPSRTKAASRRASRSRRKRRPAAPR